MTHWNAPRLMAGLALPLGLVITFPRLGITQVTAQISTAPVAIVGNAQLSTATFIDAGSYQVTGTVSTGNTPNAVTITPDGTRAYIVNTGGNSVSVIDMASRQNIANVPVGNYPYGAQVTPDGSRVYVPNNRDGSISVISTSTNTVVATLTGFQNPVGIAFTPDGTLAYATNAMNQTLSVLDTNPTSPTYNTVLRTITLGGQGLQHVALSPDGSRLYASSQNSGTVDVISLPNEKVIATISNVYNAAGLAVTPDGKRVFVAASEPGANVFVIDTATNTLVQSIQGPTSYSGYAIATANTMWINFDPDSAGGAVGVYNPSTAQLIATIAVDHATGIGFAPGLLRLTSSQNPSSANGPVTFTASINTNQGTATGTVTFMDGSTTLGTVSLVNGSATYTAQSLAPGVHAVYAVYGGDATFAGSTSLPVFQRVLKISTAPVAVVGNANLTTVTFIDTASYAPTGSLPLGNTPYAITITPDGSRAYVTNLGGNTVSVIDMSSRQSIATIPVGNYPAGIRVTPDGSRVYVPNNRDGSISVISTSTNTVVATITGFQNPVSIAFTSDGALGYATNAGTMNMLSVIDTNPASPTYNRVLRPIAVPGQGLQHLAITPDGSRIYASSQNSGTVSVISLPSETVIATISNCSNALGVGITADATRVFVAGSQPGGPVYVIDTATNTLIQTISGLASYGIFAAPTANTMWMNFDPDYPGGAVGVYSSATNQLIASIAVDHATGIGFAPGLLRLTSDQNPGVANVTFTASINTSQGTATGTVTFMDGNTTLGVVSLVNGSASYTAQSLATGVHPIYAVYSGDATFAGGTSLPIYERMGKANQTITFGPVTPPPPYIMGMPFTVSARASSGLPVSFYAQATGYGPSPCLVVGISLAGDGSTFAQVYGASTGTCLIVATQAGNDSYNPAGPIFEQVNIVAITPSGSNVSTSSTVQSTTISATFNSVTGAGLTTMTAISPASAGSIPGGFSISDTGLAFDISTTASYTAPVTSCFVLNSVTDPAQFSSLRVLHRELVNGTYQLVDETILSGPNAPNFTTKTICASTMSLSPFVIAKVVDLTPPAVSMSVTPNPAAVGTAVSLSASADDTASGGSNIALLEYSLDNGSTWTAVPGTYYSKPAQTATVSLTPPVGVYGVCVRGTDSARNSAIACTNILAIYDPNGSFVTGGGWINSPAGAYTPNPSLTGKATFGFVSKYQNGATVPSGSTQFQFDAAGFLFRSTAYQWLVVAGARAQFKGTGTVNGSGNYGFLLTAIDGQVNGGGGVDKFRIKIWQINTDGSQGGVIYDNQMGASDTADATTAVGGGSIVIH